jgi:phage shock protein A
MIKFSFLVVLFVLLVVFLAYAKSKEGIMGLLGRLKNVVKGKADRAVEQAERSDPDALYRAAIQEQEQEISDLKQLSRDASGLVFQKREFVQAVEARIAELNSDLELAVEHGDEELGPKLLSQVEEQEIELEEKKVDLVEFEEEANLTMDAYNSAQEELQNLIKEHKQAAAMIKSSEVMQKISDRR